MKKGQGLPITTIVLVAIAVAVAAIGIIYILSSGGKGFSITETFWSTGGNMTQNASQQAGQPPSSGTTTKCSSLGEPCMDVNSCCDKTNMRCYAKSFSDYGKRKTCNGCASSGEFCSGDQDCCSGLACQELFNGQPTSGSYCG